MRVLSMVCALVAVALLADHVSAQGCSGGFGAPVGAGCSGGAGRGGLLRRGSGGGLLRGGLFHHRSAARSTASTSTYSQASYSQVTVSRQSSVQSAPAPQAATTDIQIVPIK